MVEMLRSIVIMATMFQNSAFATNTAIRCEGVLFQVDKKNKWMGFGRDFENRSLVVRANIIDATNWSIEAIFTQCTKGDQSDYFSDCANIGLDIGADRNNKTEVFRIWKQSTTIEIQRTHPGAYDLAMNGTFGLKLDITNRKFPVVTINDAEIQTSDVFYCPNCIIRGAFFQFNKARLEEVCSADFENPVRAAGPEYHRLILGHCVDTRQETAGKSHRFSTNEHFTKGRHMNFFGTTNTTWSVKFDLLACVKRSVAADDCFLLVFDAHPSRNGKDIDCQVSKKSAASDLLERTHHTFYNAIKSDGLIIRLFNLNNVLRIVFNDFEIRLSSLTYCENCTIQLVNMHVEGYQLEKVCYQTINGSLPLPSTKVDIGRCYYKNTKQNLKDIILQVSLGDRNDNLTYYGSVAQNSWYFKILLYQVIDRPSLLFHVEPDQSTGRVYSTMEYNDVNGNTFSYGPFSIPFQSINIDGLHPIEVTIKYKGRYSGNYKFFINGHDSQHLFIGNVFNRFNVSTQDSYVDKVCVTPNNHETTNDLD